MPDENDPSHGQATTRARLGSKKNSHVTKDEVMIMYLAWTAEGLADLEGPWHEVQPLAPALIVVDSAESLSAGSSPG